MDKLILLYLILSVFIYSNEKTQELLDLKKREKNSLEMKPKIDEPIEKKVLRNQENKNETVNEGLRNANERLDFLLSKEAEIVELEKELGINISKNNKVNSDEFKKNYKKFIMESNKLEKLKLENIKLNQYLNRLNAIEKELE